MNRSRLTRTLTAFAAIVAALVGVTTLAAPAQAWDQTYVPGRVEYSLLCEDGRITISTSISVQSGYFNGQHAVYRYYLTNGGGYSGTSGWSGSKLMPYSMTEYRTTTHYVASLHSNAVIPAARGQHWGVWVQAAWWNGSSWSYSQWNYQPTRVTTLTARYSGMSAMTLCYT